MTDYRSFLAQDRRLVILRVLAEVQGYSANDSVMAGALAQLGHAVARDTVRADYGWLAEQDLVSVETVQPSLHVARLTERGGDVAAGRAVVPGVRRPSPGG